MRVSAVLVCFFAVTLAGCDAEPTSEAPQQVSDAAPPALPSPNYVEVKKGVYYYTSAVSENAQKDGRAVGQAIGIRYKGKNADGDFMIQSTDGSSFTCSDPCRIIHFGDDAVEYDPSSVIGAMFEDAANGFLETSAAK